MKFSWLVNNSRGKRTMNWIEPSTWDECLAILGVGMVFNNIIFES
jgi:hypothetical protein